MRVVTIMQIFTLDIRYDFILPGSWYEVCFQCLQAFFHKSRHPVTGTLGTRIAVQYVRRQRVISGKAFRPYSRGVCTCAFFCFPFLWSSFWRHYINKKKSANRVVIMITLIACVTLHIWIQWTVSNYGIKLSGREAHCLHIKATNFRIKTKNWTVYS